MQSLRILYGQKNRIAVGESDVRILGDRCRGGIGRVLSVDPGRVTPGDDTAQTQAIVKRPLKPLEETAAQIESGLLWLCFAHL